MLITYLINHQPYFTRVFTEVWENQSKEIWFVFTSVMTFLLPCPEGTCWYSEPQILLEIKQSLEDLTFHFRYILNEIIMEPEINLKNFIIFIQQG